MARTQSTRLFHGRISLTLITVCVIFTAAQPAHATSSSFIGSTTEYALVGGMLGATALLEWKPINQNHPLIGGEQRSYIERERVPDWLLGATHVGALAVTRFHPATSEARVRYSHGYVMAASVNAFATSLTKAIVGRRRPNYEDAPNHGTESNSKSFYSGHASNSFLIATYLSLYTWRQADNRAWEIGIPAMLYAAATYTAWTRVAEHRHYAGDVIAGAVAGTTVGALVFTWYDRMAPSNATSARIAPYPRGVAIILPL